jgi:hypothetical protein
MEMVGVRGVRTWTKHGREPSAGRAPHRLHECNFLRVCRAPDRDATAVGEEDCHEVDRDSLAVGAGFRADDLFSAPALVAVSSAATGAPSDASPSGANRLRAKLAKVIANSQSRIGRPGRSSVAPSDRRSDVRRTGAATPQSGSG